MEIHDGTERRSTTAVVFGLLEDTVTRSSEDAAPRMGGTFLLHRLSMAPRLNLAITIAGFVLGREARRWSHSNWHHSFALAKARSLGLSAMFFQLDVLPPFQHGLTPTEIDIGRRQIVKAFMVAPRV